MPDRPETADVPHRPEKRWQAPRWQARWRAHPVLARQGDRYGLVLLVLVSSYMISAFTASRFWAAAQSVLFLVTLVLVLRTSGVSRPVARVVVVVTVAGSAVAVALALGHATSAGLGVANVCSAAILLAGAVIIVRRVLSKPTVSLQSIFGAVSAYLLIGLMFASVYGAMSHFQTTSFFASGSKADAQNLQYFSFTTLTTLGYGDFTAAASGGRAVAMLEALGGQVFLATLVARLVSAYRGTPTDGRPHRPAFRRVGAGPEDGEPPSPGGAPTPSDDPTPSDGPTPSDDPAPSGDLMPGSGQTSGDDPIPGAGPTLSLDVPPEDARDR